LKKDIGIDIGIDIGESEKNKPQDQEPDWIPALMVIVAITMFAICCSGNSKTGSSDNFKNSYERKDWNGAARHAR
jgi:hypothetical protein